MTTVGRPVWVRTSLYAHVRHEASCSETLKRDAFARKGTRGDTHMPARVCASVWEQAQAEFSAPCSSRGIETAVCHFGYFGARWPQVSPLDTPESVQCALGGDLIVGAPTVEHLDANAIPGYFNNGSAMAPMMWHRSS